MIGRRVVITGLGVVSPLGNDLATNWANLLARKSGIGPLTRFDPSNHDTHIAAEVKDFHPEQYIPPKQVRRMELFSKYAVACSKMALADAGWEISPEEGPMVGVIIGCGMGGLETIESCHARVLKDGPRKISPFFIPILIANIAAGQVAMFTGAKGTNLATTSACASALHGIGYAYSDIKLGRCEAVLCGGTESVITPLGIGGFNAMKALSTRNDEPEKASRPFDNERDGFVMGEGAGVLLLESLEHAKARGAKIYAELVGFGASCDAYHVTAPDEKGEGMALAMRNAIREAEIRPEDVDSINAHGTSTKLNDICETRALRLVFGKHAYKLPITANKSQIGHLLGAAGGAESVFSVMTLKEGIIPATINLEHPDPECDLDYVADGPRNRQVEYVMCNSFGFGGTNASILYKRFEE